MILYGVRTMPDDLETEEFFFASAEAALREARKHLLEEEVSGVTQVHRYEIVEPKDVGGLKKFAINLLSSNGKYILNITLVAEFECVAEWSDEGDEVEEPHRTYKVNRVTP